MPEGDTVWRTARRLNQALSGSVLSVGRLQVPQHAEDDLAGQRVVETVSRGKHLLTRLDQVTLHTHLKMEGSWHLYKAGSRWRSPGFQARVVLATTVWQAVGFRLGSVDLVPPDQEDRVVGHLGPDLLGADWSTQTALRRLQDHPERPVSEALLDQRNLAGIGNLYKCEALFVLGVHPQTPVGDVAVLPQLVDKAQKMLLANREHPQQSTTGSLRRGETHWVYGRTGQPCRRCGTRIERATFPTAEDASRGVIPFDPRSTARSPGGEVAHRRTDRDTAVGRPSRARESYWCPACQPSL